MVDCKLTSFGGLKTAVEYVDQIEKLASALFESCGKDGLRDYLGPMVSTLKELTNDHTCSSRSLFPFTFDYSTSMPPTTESGQRLIGIEAERLIGGKQCHARSFGARASTTFNARSFNVINMESARESFATIVNVLSKLDRHNLKQLGEFICNLPGGKLPCELLSMPRNEEGCQLTQRVERLYNFVKTQCDPDFAATYDHVMESLIQHSRPTVNDCMPPGEPMLSNKAGQEMAALFQEEFGDGFKDMIRTEVKNQRQLYADQSKQRKRVVAMEKNEKAEKAFEKAKKRAEEQARKLQEIMARRRQKNMMMDFVEEAEEAEEVEGCFLDRNIENFHSIAVRDFEAALGTLNAGKDDDVRFMRHFKIVLKFVEDQNWGSTFDCDVFNAIYGGGSSDVGEMINSAHLLAESVESSCEADFMLYFMTLQGRYDVL